MTQDKGDGNVHGNREYASLSGGERFYKQVLRDVIGKEDWDYV